MTGLDALLAEPLGVCAKGLPDDLAEVPLRRVGELGMSLWAGDLLCLGISHPCGAFDRWRTLLEVDPHYTVTRAIRTFF